MSNHITIARPYARALFDHALAHKNLDFWLDVLRRLAAAVTVPAASAFINNPASSLEQHIALMQAVSQKAIKENPLVNNWIALLANNHRLMVLPEITTLYEELKAEHEKEQSVDVLSFSALSKAQEKQLAERLSTRLQRSVVLNINIDPKLLGGAIIFAGDLVIDGSVRGQLHKLAATIAA